MCENTMKILILDGSDSENSAVEVLFDQVVQQIESFGEKFDLQIIHLKELEEQLVYCQGCFGCWVETPGKCKYVDAAQDIAKETINADIVIYFTPITFGGYSALLKKALDRNICLLLPYFKKVQGEIHHKKRYKKYPALIGIGYQDQDSHEEAEIFASLLARNAINMWAPYSQTFCFPLHAGKQEILANFQQMLSQSEGH